MSTELHRRFSPLTLLMMSINGMVGSAWLFAPLYAARIAGPASIISWLLGGIGMIVIALSFVELTLLLPVAGGTAQIPQLSHGTFTSFMLSWTAWLSCVTTPPIEVQAILQYASTYVPVLTHSVNGVPVLTGYGLLGALILMLLLSLINIFSFKGLVGFNFCLITFKIFVILLLIASFTTTQFHAQNFSGISLNFLKANHDWPSILSAVAAGGIAFAFAGFKHGVELAGETRRLNFAMPLAIVGSVFICIVLYVGLEVAFIGAISPALLSHGWHQLSFAGDVGPFAGLAASLGLFLLLSLLYIDAIISPMGAGLVYITSTARILYAMSRIGYMPKFLSRVNQESFPFWAITINFIFGMGLFIPLAGWQAMANFLVSIIVISYAMGPIALLCLRRGLPQVKRPFRLPFAKGTALLAFYFCNLFSYWTGWHTIYKLAIALFLGFLLFLIAYFRGRLEKNRLGLKAMFWLVPYFLGLITISYAGSFGGRHFIPFGWDFLVIAIFSIIILVLAVKTRSLHIAEEYEKLKERYHLVTALNQL